MECLFSVFLPRDLAPDTVALLGKILRLKLLLFALESGVHKVSAATLIKAGGILLLLITFLGFSCWSRFGTSSLFTGENVVFPLVVILLRVLLFYS